MPQQKGWKARRQKIHAAAASQAASVSKLGSAFDPKKFGGGLAGSAHNSMVRLVSMSQIHNSALDFIRLRYSATLGEAVCMSVQGRLIEDKEGEDGAPVRTGGFRTGQMWRSFAVVYTRRGAKGAFRGSSFSSWWYTRELKKLRNQTDDELLMKFKALRKQRAKDLTEQTGKKVKVSATYKNIRVQNRFKAAHVQWGAANPKFRDSDFANRSFLGYTQGEAMAALKFTQHMLELALPHAEDMVHRVNEAFRYSARLAREIKKRGGGAKKRAR